MDQFGLVHILFILPADILFWRYHTLSLFQGAKQAYMGIPCNIFYSNVHLFYYRLMEALKDSAFITALLPLLIIIFIIAVGVVLLYQHFQKNIYMQKLKQETLKTMYQNELLRSNIEVQEEERKRIAQDLHDELGAVLSIMRMNMVMLEQKSEKGQENILGGLQNVRHLAETALASVRGISHRLMPPQLEAFGLIKTLESVVTQINNADKINIRLTTPASITYLSRPTELGLYRIIMELINNTIKHSGASEIDIEIISSNSHIECEYSDNGKGITDVNMNGGLGHKSIEGRINALNGTFDIGNGLRGGFSATIRIPTNPS